MNLEPTVTNLAKAAAQKIYGKREQTLGKPTVVSLRREKRKF
jgi:hypothetical protein